jgi:regulator of RNase E activity RraA
VVIHPGDLIMSGSDGLVVVPQPLEDKVLARALQNAHGEKAVREGIRAGRKLR